MVNNRNRVLEDQQDVWQETFATESWMPSDGFLSGGAISESYTVSGVQMDLFDQDKEFVYFTTSDLKKYIIFLKDWVLGQIFMFPKSNITKWKKFDVISFPWYMYHATANTSHQNKELLLVTGV